MVSLYCFNCALQQPKNGSLKRNFLGAGTAAVVNPYCSFLLVYYRFSKNELNIIKEN
jgi:hypothetical protein